MEKRLRQAANEGCKVIVVRADDFFGPQAGNSWFAQGLIKPGQTVKAISEPNKPGVGHQWAYLPDVAHTMVELLQRRDALEPFAPFHMAGHWDADGTQMAAAIQLLGVLGREPHVPLDEAVEAALEGMGCLQQQPVHPA